MTTAETLSQYARLTAADTGSDYASAVRMMRDEPEHVAEEVACSVDVVISWCDAQTEVAS